MSKARRTSSPTLERYKTTGDGTVQWGGGRPATIGGAGAMGGGDTFRQRIGRNRKPFSPHGMGAASQAADSGFSLRSDQPNIGRGYLDDNDDDELAFLIAMFPEQEPDQDDNYIDDPDDYLPMTSKIPRRPKLKELCVFDEGYIVENSRYNLVKALDNNLSEGIVDIGVDIAGDVASALIGTIPGLGDAFAASMVVQNIVALKLNLETADERIKKHRQNPSDDTVEDLHDSINDITTNLFDVFQRLLEALPDPGASELTSASASVVKNATTIFSEIIGAAKKLKGFSSGLKSFIAKHSGIAGEKAGLKISKRFGGRLGKAAGEKFGDKFFSSTLQFLVKNISKAIDSDYTPKSIRKEKPFLLAIPKKLIELSDLIEDYERKKALEDYKDDLEDYIVDLLKQKNESKKMKTKKMSAKELRNMIAVIKESVYEDYLTYHEDQPHGYESRDVPEVDEEGNVVPCEDVVSDDAVNYSVEDGVVSYHGRDMSVREAALRNLIRKGISQLHEDDKKKV